MSVPLGAGSGVIPDGAASMRSIPRPLSISFVPIAGLLFFLYRRAFFDMWTNWNSADSYYSHGALIPLISLGLAWLKRNDFFAAPAGASALGYAPMIAAALLLIASDFLGFGVFGQLSIVPMLAGLSLLLLGRARTRVLWFPLAFLFMMVPLPGSVVQSIAFRLKIFAADAAVFLVKAAGFPMRLEGSFIHFNDDSLLVGDVCGGLRSLIALLAIGVLMAYFSKTRPWAQVMILGMSAPIAVAANVFRIVLLCVVGYYKGSEFAAGRFHDVSGILIFAVAFVLFFTLEGALRAFAATKPVEETTEPRPS